MQVSVVNMIPNSLSGETNQDSESQISVNPSNTSQVVGSAFTADPLGGPNAPIYVSLDGGNTWVLNTIVPSSNAMTGDISVRFSGSGVLYAGILRGGNSFRLNILRTSTFSGPALMTLLVDRTPVDQPYVEARNVAGTDRVYIADNDLSAPKKATIDRSLSAATAAAPAGFNQIPLESRPTWGQDGPSVRPAVHSDGTVYGVYFGERAYDGVTTTADIVIVRDDNWATGPNAFMAPAASVLIDPGDLKAGMRVVTGRSIAWWFPLLGQERIGSHLAIAVDPSNSSRVYIAWCDTQAGVYTMHVRQSSNRGLTWSGDLRTIQNALNPGLAVTDDGRVGLLYQQVASGRWVTHVEVSTNDWGSPPSDIVLATVPANAPTRTFYPYIGDYACLLAVGNHFYGSFCANNTPDHANFPHGVHYQRNANFTTHTLLATDLVTPVAVSIDPFFFHLSPIIKIWKEFKPEIKELKVEFKELIKPEIDIPHKGLKEWKDKDKDIYEGGKGIAVEGDPWRLFTEIAERIDSIEQRLGDLHSFIRPEERPNLGENVLKSPPAQSSEGGGLDRRGRKSPRRGG